MIVVDVSALPAVLFRTSSASAIKRLLSDADWSLHAPHLIDVEVAQVVGRYVKAGEVDFARGRAPLDLLANTPMPRYPHGLLPPRLCDLRDILTVYDAAYGALAETLHVPLPTSDRRLATAAGRHAAVEVIR